LLLGGFLEQERLLTFWARFGYRLVPIDSIAVGVHGAAIKNFAAFRFLYDQFPFAARARAVNPCRFLLDVFALWIV
jgi:hypothetical protein